ncbi:GntR family transcriptional regulator [Labedaea rhizosphaerae]|uniref:Regulatory GntR family protein n=1 Tax=Labedaea rhizosphaerae TaxID=598644 RepID=A0A4R6SLQ2_LABRH|nr:winged helix-turn-helix domain-containing protein [Labedaea rhizosphaerae]TDQ04804.1 regulatory GntR family protein [Labedaea rhizosphaerae]
MGKLDPNSPQAPKFQIADDLVAAIRSGEYAPGDPLPSYKALADDYGVAIGTVQSAIAVLRERGVVVTRQGTGSSVHPDLDPKTLPDRVAQQVAVPAADLTEMLALLHEMNERLKVIEANTRAD